MKKIISMFLILMLNHSFAEESTTVVKKKKKTKKIEPITAVDSKKEIKKDDKAPCDTKEDILKKLEEEKQKQKPFALQGGNTGCSVDKK